MCQKRNSTEIPYKNSLGYNAKIDECLAEVIVTLNEGGIKTLASCCGHKRYMKTIVMEHTQIYRKNGVLTRKIIRFEYLSNKIISRKKRFYKRDEKGYYFIPEVDKEKR